MIVLAYYYFQTPEKKYIYVKYILNFYLYYQCNVMTYETHFPTLICV